MDVIRLFDVVFSLIAIIILAPLFLIIAIAIKLTSAGNVLYIQNRVGKNGVDFKVFKFRSMYANADRKGLLTVGGNDARVTPVGYYLRRYKLDELPQLLNVLAGEMSIVGPRPEVRKFVDLYTPEQQKVLQVVPGITDYASIAFRNENELLAQAVDPETYYVKEILPQKIELNFLYIRNRSIKVYFDIIFKTLATSAKGK